MTRSQSLVRLALVTVILTINTVLPAGAAPGDPVDLVIAQTDAPDPVAQGQLLTYTLTVTNTGSFQATDIRVTDNLPGGVTFVSATAGYDRSGNVVVWEGLGPLNPGDSLPPLVVSVIPEEAGTLSNRAEVESVELETNPANNTDVEETNVARRFADLAITKTDSPDPAEKGDELKYTLRIVNNGPDTATGVTVTDELPADVTFIAAGSSQGECSRSADKVTCKLGTMLDGATATVTINVLVKERGTIENTARVKANQADPFQANNKSDAVTDVPGGVADLSIIKSDSPDPMGSQQPTQDRVAGALTYTLRVTNHGPDEATDVQVTDELPAGVIFHSAGSSQGSCERSGDSTVTCDLGTVLADAQAVVTIKVIPKRTGTLVDKARVTANQRDPRESNNVSVGVTSIPRAMADVSLLKTDSPDPADRGQLLTYSIRVTNNGPDGATGVNVTDVLPEEVIFHSAGSSQGSCNRLEALTHPFAGMTVTPSGNGYWLAATDGGVFPFGDAPALGSAAGTRLNKPIVAMAATPSGNGYWLVASDGGVLTYGDGTFFGSTGAITLVQPIVGAASTPSGRGYWLVASDGGVFAFGDAPFVGSTGGLNLNQPIVGMMPTTTGRGYWLVASDGGIFAFGDASFLGSTGGIRLNQPIVGATATSSGHGYWLVASDGGIFNFGDASFLGSAGGIRLQRPIVGMAPTPDGKGYWLHSVDGGVFAFAEAPFLGGLALDHDIVSCNLGSLANGAAATVTIRVIPKVSGTIVNRAAVVANERDPFGSNNADAS
jgi:uncharacterized repeat protein (TIGR01451 family)